MTAAAAIVLAAQPAIPPGETRLSSAGCMAGLPGKRVLLAVSDGFPVNTLQRAQDALASRAVHAVVQETVGGKLTATMQPVVLQ